MIGRGAPHLDGEGDPRTGSELVGVESQAESGGTPGVEHGAALIGVERAGLAERVDPAGVWRARREHLVADVLDVRVGTIGELGRHDVRTEERRLAGELAGDPEAPGLVDRREAVARLDLDRRDAGAASLVAPRRGE